jgi:hypothetical protein
MHVSHPCWKKKDFGYFQGSFNILIKQKQIQSICHLDFIDQNDDGKDVIFFFEK